MFIAVEGIKNEGIFIASSIILPRINLHSQQNNFLIDKSVKICIFGCYSDQSSFINTITNKVQPDITIISTNTNNIKKDTNHIIIGENSLTKYSLNKPSLDPLSLKKYFNSSELQISIKQLNQTDQINIINNNINPIDNNLNLIDNNSKNCISSSLNKDTTFIVPCKCTQEFLPIKFNEFTNPLIIELHKIKILFLDFNIFKNKENGIFLNVNHLESFLKSYISQSSANSFSKVDFECDQMPNIIVISQEFYPFVIEISGIKIISLPPISDGSYAIIDTSNDQVEVIYDTA